MRPYGVWEYDHSGGLGMRPYWGSGNETIQGLGMRLGMTMLLIVFVQISDEDRRQMY